MNPPLSNESTELILPLEEGWTEGVMPHRNKVSLEELHRLLPEEPLYGPGREESGSGTGWLLSPQPYVLSSSQVELLYRIGPCLWQFIKATDLLYRSSLKEGNLSWVKELFHAGKPQHLLSFAQMNRFKSHLPSVIRPDLLVTEKGFSLCEIDAVPGGIGFTGALYKAYSSLEFSLLGEAMPEAFLRMLLEAFPNKELTEPMIAVVVSDEASDYRKEMAWLVDQVSCFYRNITLLHPKDLTMERNALGFIAAEGIFKPVHIIYRFFELFDLPNIPQIELIQYALKKGLVFSTPPFKPHLEEKLTLALIHYPVLERFWVESLGEADFHLLKELIPESWILDPACVPPHAKIMPELIFPGTLSPNGGEGRVRGTFTPSPPLGERAGVRGKGKQLHDFTNLEELTQRERQLVIKPSGFSPLAWGSRGITVGHDVSKEVWQNALREAFARFSSTPYLMQRFESCKVEPYLYFHPETGNISEGSGRTRLCPYYFILQQSPKLVGVLATTCPKDKKVIHGMRDGVMRPAYSSTVPNLT